MSAETAYTVAQLLIRERLTREQVAGIQSKIVRLQQARDERAAALVRIRAELARLRGPVAPAHRET